MEKIDNKILDRLQTGLKLEASPFQKIAAELGIEAEELLRRIKKLKKEGIYSSTGGNF